MTASLYRVCTKCVIPHIENCHTCFGFGVRAPLDGMDGDVPVTAHQAHSRSFPTAPKACPECGSTETGTPEQRPTE